jgi:hypothetical protein
MADKFSGRLRGAMMACGLMGEPEELTRLFGLPPRVARRWLALKDARVHAADLVVVSHKLQVRMYWLVTGHGFPTRRHMYTNTESQVMELLDAMTPEQAARWISRGRRIAQG